MYQTDQRFIQLQQWLEEKLEQPVHTIEPASSDASFRRYFRVISDQESLIAMDAPAPRENVNNFVSVATVFRNAGVHVPDIFAGDDRHGFLLLSDFGNCPYFDALAEANADELYADAFDVLFKIQSRITQQTTDLPVYDAGLLFRELAIFTEWFILALLGIKLSDEQQQMLEASFRKLVDSALEQPQVCVHRDFHCKNLMRLEANNPGVLDFQDALFGPLTYDLASLLRDCYICWPEQSVEAWIGEFYQRSLDAGVFSSGISLDQYRRWFDRMAMQRHLKAIGIFSRLKIRDGKPGYLNDIPTTLRYVTDVCRKDDTFEELGEFLSQVVISVMQQHPAFQS